LVYDLKELYFAEEQIMEALPDFIDIAENAGLKEALTDHLQLTNEQIDRLDEAGRHLGERKLDNQYGFIPNIFHTNHRSKGIEGRIDEHISPMYTIILMTEIQLQVLIMMVATLLGCIALSHQDS
jgi:hypothetical protein